MAIGFMPTDEDTDARYERLNRILLELCDVVFHLVNGNPAAQQQPTARPQGAANQRVRPSSDSAAPRLPDLLCNSSGLPLPPRRRVYSQRSTPASPSCSTQHLSRTFSDLYDRTYAEDRTFNPNDDEVFLTTPPASVTRAVGPPPRQRRRRRRSTSLKESKKRSRAKTEEEVEDTNWVEGQTRLEDLETPTEKDTVDGDSTSSETEKVTESESSMISTLLSTSLGGSLWTAVVIMVGWRLLANKR